MSRITGILSDFRGKDQGVYPNSSSTAEAGSGIKVDSAGNIALDVDELPSGITINPAVDTMAYYEDARGETVNDTIVNIIGAATISTAVEPNGGLVGPADSLALDNSNLPAGTFTSDVATSTVTAYNATATEHQAMPIQLLMDSFMDHEAFAASWNAPNPAPSSNPLWVSPGNLFKVVFGSAPSLAWWSVSNSNFVTPAAYTGTAVVCTGSTPLPAKYFPEVTVSVTMGFTRQYEFDPKTLTGAIQPALLSLEVTTGYYRIETLGGDPIESAANDGSVLFGFSIGPYRCANRTIGST